MKLKKDLRVLGLGSLMASLDDISLGTSSYLSSASLLDYK